MHTNPPPVPVQVAREVVDSQRLFELVLAAIEERCSSYALDDETDQVNAARAIADELAARGVRP